MQMKIDDNLYRRIFSSTLFLPGSPGCFNTKYGHKNEGRDEEKMLKYG